MSEDVGVVGRCVQLNRTKGDSVRIFLLDNDGRQEWW